MSGYPKVGSGSAFSESSWELPIVGTPLFQGHNGRFQGLKMRAVRAFIIDTSSTPRCQVFIRTHKHRPRFSASVGNIMHAKHWTPANAAAKELLTQLGAAMKLLRSE